MRLFLAVTVAVCIYAVGCSAPQAQQKQPPSEQPQTQQTQAASQAPANQTASDPKADQGIPDTILFTASNGDVTFTHKKHYERVGGDCSVCHPKVFPQSRAPINYKKALHRVAEAEYSSCAHCHAVGATAFAADSNCTKCHMPRYPKS
jgi:c(7)-type cytochrome triheme protein